MKLKYYLRGLGIGMVVTALLMGYSNKTHAATTASEAVSETEESTEETSLGGVLADRNVEVQTEVTTETEAVTTEPIIIRDEQPVTAETTVESSEAVSEETSAETETTTEEESSTEQTASETPQEVADVLASAASSGESSDTSDVISHGESITLNIVHGDDSGTVSRKLQTAGLISDATEFDAYLMQHGYDKKISVGTVEIPLGSTWVEIAELLAGK